MIQILMVTGGIGETSSKIDSTEILEASGDSWKTLTTARLPSPRAGLRAGTVNNVVFIFGKNSLNAMLCNILKLAISFTGGFAGGHSFNTILSFNKTEESWQPAGQMTVPRYSHAVEVTEDVSQHCP